MEFLDFAILVSLIVLTGSFYVAMIRVVRGPTIADRIVGMDLISFLVIGFITVYSIYVKHPVEEYPVQKDPVYLNATIILALVSFLSVIAIAQYVERPMQKYLDDHDGETDG